MVNWFENIESEKELTARYRELSKKYHPDLTGSDGADMAEINSQYKSLLKVFRAVEIKQETRAVKQKIRIRQKHKEEIIESAAGFASSVTRAAGHAFFDKYFS